MPDSTAVARRAQPSLAVALAGFPRRHPRAAGLLLVWAAGLYCAFLARPPPVSEAQAGAFKAKVQEAEGILAELTRAERALMDAGGPRRAGCAPRAPRRPGASQALPVLRVPAAEMEQQPFKAGWFWRFNREAREEVRARQPAVDAARAVADDVRRRRDKVLREAKAALGLWSEAGVDEGRELFWDSFASGKVFAQRQSFFDAVFAILDSRDRDWLGLLLQLLFQTLVNFCTGLAAAVFLFLVQLPGLIWTYQPALWSAVSFFAVAGVAAISVVAGYLGLLLGAGGAVAYSTLHLAVQQAARVEAARERQRQRLDYDRDTRE